MAALGFAVLSIGLSLVAAKFTKKKSELQEPDQPTSLAMRGSFLPRVLGRRRVGVIFSWAGDRTQTKERGSGGKGIFSKRKKVKIWRESGWHLLAVGPGKVLYDIEQQGKVIFKGPITAISHPSGTTIDLGNEGSFRIFWGEVDQPPNSFLGSNSRRPAIGVTSSWPNVFYIEWTAKRLSESPIWPELTYDIEVEPVESHLSNTPAYMAATDVIALDGTVFEITDATDGAEGFGHFTIQGYGFNEFLPNGIFRLAGNTGLPDQDLEVHHALASSFDVTHIWPKGGLSGATADGTLQSYSRPADDGYNPAHILAELWFSAWPHGIKQDKSQFDMDSLEDLGTLAVAEDLKGSVIAKEGQNLRSWMANIHQDLGVVLPHNFSTGLLQFVPVRAPTSSIPVLAEDMITALPEIETLHGERPIDRIIFSFADRENRFRVMTIGVDDSGQSTRQEYFRARTVPIVSTINFETANIIAERRSQEELAGRSVQRILANRGARLLLPGTQLSVEGIAGVLLVTSIELDPLSGQVTVNTMPDFLGATTSEFLQITGQVSDPERGVEPDPQWQLLEMPEWLSGPEQVVMMARLRAHEQIDGAAIHISRDDTTFTLAGTDISIMQGGTLATAISLDEFWEIDEGPIIDAVGPDIASVLDLSSDLVSWRNGRQFVSINGELFFLKTIVALGGDQYRLDGLIRARYDTQPEAHEIGDEVFIIQDDDGLPIEDVLVEPEVTLYSKSQALGAGNINMALVPSEAIALYGKGIRPVPVREIRFDTLHVSVPDGVSTHSWADAIGGDLPATWGYYTPRSPGTGAGFAGAGVPQEGADPEGVFLVEILSSGDVLKRSTTTDTNDYIYTEADRVADFSGEPASFKIRVTQLRSGLSSDTTIQTFTKV
jgi:hypothetical protein